MSIQATIQNAVATGRVPMGHYIVLDPMGRIVRIDSMITSFSAMTFRRTNEGLRRVC